MSSVNSKKEYLISEAGDNSIVERFHIGLGEAGIPKRGRNLIVATETGYSSSMVAKLLSGHAKLSWRFINAVCSSFNLRGEWLADGIGPIFVPINEDEKLKLKSASEKILNDKLEYIFGTKPVIGAEKQLSPEELQVKADGIFDQQDKIRENNIAYIKGLIDQLENQEFNPVAKFILELIEKRRA